MKRGRNELIGSASDELFLSGLENLTSAVAESFAKLLQASVVVNPIGYFV